MPITAVVHACPNCKTTITEDIYAQRQQAIRNLAAGLDMPPGLLEEFPEGHGHYAAPAPIGPDYNGDWPDPEPDDLTREQLAEHDPMWRAVADTLDEWLSRLHGVTSSHHNTGAFLDFLALQGYQVTAIPKPLPDFATLVPGYLD